LLKQTRRNFSRTIEMIRGNTSLNTDPKDLNLRGIKLNSNYNDNPNMIFFVDYFDKPENWLPFFINNGVLDHRNVYVLNNPNFGNSDYTNKDSLEALNHDQIASTVEQFMWANKISTATIAGHGFGARTAMILGCTSPELVTGIFAIDYTPMSYKKFDVVWRLKNALKALSVIQKDMKSGQMKRKDINKYIEDNVEHPKMQELFKQNVKHTGNDQFCWDFNMDLMENHFDKLVDWSPRFGLYPGRVNFAFPDHSDYVHLNSHSIQMQKVAVSCRNFRRDILPEFTETDEPYSNHFVYEDQNLAESFAHKMKAFLHMYDGVDLLLSNRRDVYEKTFVPIIANQRKDGLKDDAFPNHFHHNWKYRTA